ncbi:hypothetical protein MMC07_004592 [Pseudocyphellaria aurata]|nr:hypothetical protein [Pseudocyphellaria aurata]
MARNPNTSISSPIGSEMQARQSSSSKDELADNFHHEAPEENSPLRYLKQRFDALRSSQGDIPSNSNDTPRIPTQADFLPSVSLVISEDEVDEPVKRLIIYLHQSEGDQAPLQTLAQRLKKKLPRSAYILIRDEGPLSSGSSGQNLADPPERCDEGFLNASSSLLTHVIKDVLISKCNFMPSGIMVLGHRQGGTTALAAMASWDVIEFGGVISIGGPLPSYIPLPSSSKAKTPALILRAERGDIHPSALQLIKNTFVTADVDTQEGASTTVPHTKDTLRPILDFFAHRFHREEWEKQAMLSFDGGGIRGLGSLFILRELMNKIGDEEKKIDQGNGSAASSFWPCLYKPTHLKRKHTNNLEDEIPSATNANDLPNSSLYLPCHYFDYAAGTSTGGLISIMLSRFRMTVDDCIDEYQALGEKVFGHPRPLAWGAILWHKFNAENFERVIRDVTSRHSEARDFEATFPSDEDLCRTAVYAYADHSGNDMPYTFRTYLPSSRRGTNKNYGGAPHLPIWQVARATSAAPGKFSPIEINKGSGSNPRDRIRFKDGGFGTNNPTRAAYYDMVDKHGSKSKIGLVISIGAGDTPLNYFASRKGNLSNAIANLKAAIKLPSRTLGTHDEMLRLAKKDGEEESFLYYRFGGGETLGELALDEWKSHHFTKFTGDNDSPGCKTIEKIKHCTDNYLKQQEVQDDLDACAELLVRRRRLRTRDVSKWDRYASASYYECNLKGCEARRIHTIREYQEHIRSQHGIRVADSVFEKTMQSSRRCWMYGK